MAHEGCWPVRSEKKAITRMRTSRMIPVMKLRGWPWGAAPRPHAKLQLGYHFGRPFSHLWAHCEQIQPPFSIYRCGYSRRDPRVNITTRGCFCSITYKSIILGRSRTLNISYAKNRFSFPPGALNWKRVASQWRELERVTPPRPRAARHLCASSSSPS